jgi:hypothetical protein
VIIDVKYNHNDVTILVVEGEQGSKSLLSCGVPDVHLNVLTSRIFRFVAVKTGSQGVGHLIGEGLMQQHLKYTCLSYIFIVG